MARITNQDEFIAKAKELYDDKYDYSLVEYVKSSEKVKIICPEHGVFEKTPNKHLQGQGCPICGRNRTKVGTDEFINRAMLIHGNRYDYSKVSYQAADIKVEIICPVHGSFWQAPHEHVILQHGCPKCGYSKAGLQRCGINNVAHRMDVKEKKEATCLKHFGAKTWAESEEGRRRLHDIVMTKLEMMKATCQARYGTDFWTQSEEGRNMLHELMSSEEMQIKVRKGYQEKYGMHYMQTEEGKKRAKSYIDEERRQKMKDCMIERYGVPYSFMNETLMQKSWETKRKNGTFNTSKPEQTLYGLLCDIFGKEDICEQYSDEERYPFRCDFYVKPLDLFIELNAHWSHGGHWFDENNEDDLKQLEFLMNKAEEKGSRYYHAAIYTWTERDLLKKSTAEKNNLNYVVFWKQDLSDAREYLSSYR